MRTEQIPLIAVPIPSSHKHFLCGQPEAVGQSIPTRPFTASMSFAES